MNTSEIRTIVCAVRGRPISRATVTRAVELAIEHQAALTFIHVVNIEFMKTATPGMSSMRMVYNQLRDMAEFTMLILADRASRRGVSQVDTIIREGKIRTQLFQYLKERRPDLLVIGEPKHGDRDALFTTDELTQFIEKLSENLNLETIIVKPE